jgi:hypothetical protein
MDEIAFSRSCKDLYEPLLEKEREDRQKIISGITSKYASRGFSIPPGAMYADIGKCYKDALPIRARIVFDSCCEVYKGTVKKPRTEVFIKEILGAIQLERELITTSGNKDFNFYNTQFEIPSFATLLERYQSEISAEAKRQSQYYSSKAKLFVDGVKIIEKVENPLDLAPNLWGIGINLKRIMPWIKNKFRK